AGSLPAAGAADRAAAACWACAGAVGARPAATAVLAPNRKLRRAIGLLSSGVFLSVIATSRACRARAWLLHAGRGLRRPGVIVATRRFIVSLWIRVNRFSAAREGAPTAAGFNPVFVGSQP